MDVTAFTGSDDSVWCYLRALANKRLTLSSPFYADGNRTFKIELRSVSIDLDDEDLLHESEEGAAFRCAVPGCGRWLQSVREHETHYAGRHRHSCGVCRAHLPTQRMLELHLEESHDSVFQLKSHRQDMYRCFVESCDALNSDAASRLNHCVSEHQFPADFCYSPRPPSPRPTPAKSYPPATGRLRFSYRVPEADISFGASAVASFRRGAAVTSHGEIDMASLSEALDENPV